MSSVPPSVSHSSGGERSVRGTSRLTARLSAFVLLVTCIAPAFAEMPGEERFFADCPRRRYLHVHHEANPWDLHIALYTALSVSEFEVLQLVDWIIDLPLPGAPLRPFQRMTQAIRRTHHRLPPWRLTQRFGEAVDALQIPELSLGDATATYSVATGSTVGPGSGTIVRLHKLVDWVQHVSGDLNRLTGRLVMRPHGVIQWSLPERAIDGTQWLLVKTFTHTSLLVARMLDGGFMGIEKTAEGAINIGYRRPHQETAVFLRMPSSVYRAHELWILEHRPRLVIGAPEAFRRSTHAALAHRRQPIAIEEWSSVDHPQGEEPVIVLMTTVPVISHAPPSLRAHVVPAAWVLEEEGSEH